MNVYDMDATNYERDPRHGIQKHRENTDWNLFGQNVASFLYQTGMSVADSAAQIAAFGNGAVFLMGASAASNQAKNVIERGGQQQPGVLGRVGGRRGSLCLKKNQKYLTDCSSLNPSQDGNRC